MESYEEIDECLDDLGDELETLEDDIDDMFGGI